MVTVPVTIVPQDNNLFNMVQIKEHALLVQLVKFRPSTSEDVNIMQILDTYPLPHTYHLLHTYHPLHTLIQHLMYLQRIMLILYLIILTQIMFNPKPGILLRQTAGQTKFQ